MDDKTPQLSVDDIQQLLQHMQRTTSLLADRLANTSSSAPSTSSSVPLPYHSSSPAPQPSTSLSSSSVPSLYHSSSPAPPSTSLSSSSVPLPYHSSSSAPMSASWPSSSACPSSNIQRNDEVQANLARLFRPNNFPSGGWRGIPRKRKREVPWTHLFVCLPEPDAVAVPNAEEARFLVQCGIGKKLITFMNNMGDPTYLTEDLNKAFPPLCDAGGYTLAKSDRGKRLNKIPIPASGYSIEYLRRFVDIKRAPLYIIPLQRALTLCPSVEETPAVMERCLSCDKDFPLCDLESHVKICKQSDEECEERTPHCPESDEDEDLSLAIFQSLQSCQPVQPTLPMEALSNESPVIQGEAPPIVISDDGDIVEERQSEPMTLPTSEDHLDEVLRSEPDLIDILKNLTSQLPSGVPPRSNNVNVMRESILESAFRTFRRSRFSPHHRLNVVFVDTDGTTEGAVDDGGPSREFLRLLVLAIQDSKYFTGHGEQKNLSLVSRALESGDYRFIGQMLSVAIVHGGIRPSFFSDRLYCLVGGRPTPPINIEEVDDYELREKLQRLKNYRIKDAEMITEAREAVEEAASILSLLGCPSFLQTIDHKHALVEDAARAYIEGRTQKAMEQLVDGLQALGVAEAISKPSEVMKPFFVGGPKGLDMQDLVDLFSPQFSEAGSNRRRRENQTVMWWKDWLLEVDEGTRPVSLQKILIFASGSDTIPLLGFPYQPQLEFLHIDSGNQRRFPEANTCEVVLRLPLHPSYEQFVEYMESGILQSPTFGII